MATIIKTSSNTWKTLVRGAYIDRAPTNSPGVAKRETGRFIPLLEKPGDYSLVAMTLDLVAGYRDARR